MRKSYALALLLFLLVISIVSAEELNIRDLKILNSSTSDPLSLIAYRIIDIDKNFDSTFNTWYFFVKKDNSSIEIELENKNEFTVWNFYIEKDGIPYVFIPQPQIGGNVNDKFNFNYHINVDEAGLVKVQFNLNNIKPIRNKFLYPFDKYELFLINTTLKKDLSMVQYVKFPESLIQYESNSTVKIPIKKAKCDNKIVDIDFDIFLEAQQHLTEEAFGRLTPEMYIHDGKLAGIKATYLCPSEGGYMPCKCQPYFSEPLSIYFPIKISRSNFPSIYLFLVIGAFVVYISMYGFYKKRNCGWYLEYVYGRTTLPLILSEITVAILPPSRPLTFTLFDSIILWPLIILLIKSIIDEHKKQYPN